MGTRGITKVIHNGSDVIRQYGQWDHYPAGQGVTALEFVQNPEKVEMLKKGLANIYYPSDEVLETLSKPYTHKAGEHTMMSLEMGEKFSKDYPSLTRDTGAGILEVIASAEGLVPIHLESDEFENDELWCEGVYTIDLDNETLTTKWGNVEHIFSFAELREMSKEEYINKCEDSELLDVTE